jgi:hypothetical protein
MAAQAKPRAFKSMFANHFRMAITGWYDYGDRTIVI